MDYDMDREGVLKLVSDLNVRFVRLWFTDVLGFLKSVAITPNELETALDEGMGFDGSSIEGFARIEESDIFAKADPHTFTILPWSHETGVLVGRMMCDILKSDGTPYEGCPRWALKRNLKKAAEKGYQYFVGPELEYFYFKDSKSTELLDAGGYFDLTPIDVTSSVSWVTITNIDTQNNEITYSVAANTDSNTRTGGIFIGDRVFTILQTADDTTEI